MCSKVVPVFIIEYTYSCAWKLSSSTDVIEIPLDHGKTYQGNQGQEESDHNMEVNEIFFYFAEQFNFMA